MLEIRARDSDTVLWRTPADTLVGASLAGLALPGADLTGADLEHDDLLAGGRACGGAQVYVPGREGPDPWWR